MSITLIDNLRDDLRRMRVSFDVSTFKQNKLNFVDHTVAYFETKTIKIPLSFSPLLDELLIWRWSKNVDTRGRKMTEKGNDDFIDALMHALMHDYIVIDLFGNLRGEKSYTGDDSRESEYNDFKMFRSYSSTDSYDEFR